MAASRLKRVYRQQQCTKDQVCVWLQYAIDQRNSAVFEDSSLIARGACNRRVGANFKLAKPGVELQKPAVFGRQPTARDNKVSRKAEKWLKTYGCLYILQSHDISQDIKGGAKSDKR